MRKLKIEVNKQGMVDNLSRTFSNTTSWLTELVQNSRRANASRVNIIYEAGGGTIEIWDDGDGIQNWESLLTIAESAWDPESQENPFGLGFFACLFAADHVVIESGNRCIEFLTKNLLKGGPTTLLKTSNTVKGTHVHLSLSKNQPKLDLKVFEDVARGLPLDIYFNGKLLGAPHRPRSDDFHIEGLGWVPKGLLPNAEDPGIVFYYQGIEIEDSYASTYYGDKSKYEYLHLENHFEVKLPDRNRLVDHDQQIRGINDKIKEAKIKWLDQRLQDYGTTENAHIEFTKAYYSHIKQWCIANYFGYLLAWHYRRFFVSELPYLPEQSHDNFYDWTDSEEIVLPKTHIGLRIDCSQLYADEDKFGILAWVAAKELPFFVDSSPTSCVEPEPEDMKVRVVGERKLRGKFQHDIVFAEHIFISYHPDEVEGQLPIEWFGEVEITDGFYHDGIIYVSDSMHINDVYLLARQVEDFINWDTEMFEEAECDRAVDRLRDFITYNRKDSDDKQYLLDSLNNGDIPPQFSGKTITVKLGEYDGFKEVLVISD